MRSRALLAALALLLAAPAAGAQADTVHLAAGAYHAVPFDAAAGDRFEVEVTSDVPIDVLIVNGTDDAYATGTGGQQHLMEVLNATSAIDSGDFPSPGRWTLILDNSADPAGGANGTQNATITARVVFSHAIDVVTPPTPIDKPEGGSRNPWPVLMLTSPFWDLGVLGLGGMALWFLILAALAAWGYREGWEKVGVIALGAGLLIAAWSLIPHRGPALQTSIPLLVAAGVAWLGYRGASDGRQGLRMAFLGAGLGALLGVAIGHLVRLLWSDPGPMLLGADRFDDPAFMMPLLAGAGAFLLAFIAALVNAMEDEDEPARPESPGLTHSFTVQCLRCGTPIKVDRSMKRYRVATDRYEFACPNCHAWMEWAEPKPEGAAAA